MNKLLYLLLLLFADVAFGASSCPQHIKESVCVVESPAKEQDRYKSGRPCTDGNAKYAPAIVAAVDTFPKFVQTVICSLKKIYVEKEFFGAAWSALENDEDPNSGMIGIRKADLDSQLNLEAYDSWFEQQSFGGSHDYHLDPKLPLVRVLPKSGSKRSYLSHTLLHEVAHVLDYQKHFNQVDCDSKGNDCKARPGSWTALSWLSIEAPNPINDFSERKEICLNSCHDKYLSIDRADAFYDNLYSHGFVSQLSALNAMEDWAESFTFYVSAKYMNLHYRVVVPGGHSHELDKILASNSLKAKNSFIKKATDNLVSPKP